MVPHYSTSFQLC